MARVCEVSGTKTGRGNYIRHRPGKAGGRRGGSWSMKAPAVKRQWLPNLRKTKVTVNGKSETLNISMKTYKKLRKDGFMYSTKGERIELSVK